MWRLPPLLPQASAIGLALQRDKVTLAPQRSSRGAVAIAGCARWRRGALLAIAALRDRLRERAVAEGVARPPRALAVDIEGAESAARRALSGVAVIVLARCATVGRGLANGGARER